jgi:hypothetical protein
MKRVAWGFVAYFTQLSNLSKIGRIQEVGVHWRLEDGSSKIEML